MRCRLHIHTCSTSCDRSRRSQPVTFKNACTFCEHKRVVMLQFLSCASSFVALRLGWRYFLLFLKYFDQIYYRGPAIHCRSAEPMHGLCLAEAPVRQCSYAALVDSLVDRSSAGRGAEAPCAGKAPHWSEEGVRLAQNMQVDPCIFVGVLL